MQARIISGAIGGSIIAVALVLPRWLWGARSALQKDIVSFSSQMIAAARVTEGEQEDALFVDPYAARLAGRRALLKHRKLAKQDAAKRQEGERRTIGNITCRTKYLDDLVVMFTQSSVNTLPTYFAALAKAIAAACRSAPQDVKQVVLVGAGMDARAYRLDVPHDVQWFELDRGSVLKEKQALLGRDISNEMVYDAGMDIGQVSVKEALQNTLFDSSKATVWILEGLVMYAPQLVHIMNDCEKRISEQASGATSVALDDLFRYLSDEVNMQLLQQLEEVSAPGSVVLTTMTPISITKRPHAPSSLVGSWVWGFGEDFPQVSAKHGWAVVDSMDYSSIAALYGYEYMKKAAKLGENGTMKVFPKGEMVPECAQVVVSVLQRDTK